MMVAGSSNVDKAKMLTGLAEGLVSFVREGVQTGAHLYDVERGVFSRLLVMGKAAVDLYLDGQGDGDLGPAVETGDGRTLQRSEAVQPREVRTIFGEHCFHSYVYAAGSKEKIELRPIDARINLPKGKASYLLQEFSQMFCVEKAFAVGSRQFEAVFGQKLSVDVLEKINRNMGEQAEQFLDALAVPPAAEEGAILVVTADGKGVPLVRKDAAQVPAFEKKERPGNRRMATLGCVYTVDAHVRTPEQIVAALFRDDRMPQPESRPQAKHKHYRSYFAEGSSGKPDAVPSCYLTWTWLADEAERRVQPGQPIVRLMDGQPSLWEAAAICMEELATTHAAAEVAGEVVDILDILHVASYLWKAGKAFHSHSEQQEAFVQERLLRILRGEVSGVVTGMRSMATRHGLHGSELENVTSACNYFANNAQRMRYDEYLRAGYPIASGVIEGACRHIIKDRMEHGGMRWTLEGARRMLAVRCVLASSEWESFGPWWQADQAGKVHPHRELLNHYNPVSV